LVASVGDDGVDVAMGFGHGGESWLWAKRPLGKGPLLLPDRGNLKDVMVLFKRDAMQIKEPVVLQKLMGA
jgi:hypothetical protein